MPGVPRIALAIAMAVCATAVWCRAQGPSPDTAQEAGPGGVLVVQSYDPDYVWCQEIDQGIRQALADTGARIDTVYLDAKRHPHPADVAAAANVVRARIAAESPRVVIAVDDATQATLAVPFLKGHAAPQVIFCGVNAPLATYGYPAANISGVRERYHFREGLALIKRLVPAARTAVFLGEDSESMRYVMADLKNLQRQGTPLALGIVGIAACRTFQEWQEKVLAFARTADVFSFGPYNALQDEHTGGVVSPDAVMAWTLAHIAKPTLGFSDIAKAHGMLCGVLEAGREQGRLAGEMARDILTTGRSAGGIPVRVNVEGVVMVNLKTAERLGIAIPYAIIEAAGVVVQ